MTEEEAGERQEQEYNRLLQNFTEHLDVDEEFAGILIEEGFTSIEEVAYVPMEEMLAIDGFDEDTVSELRRRAKDVLLNKALADEEATGRFADNGWHGPCPGLQAGGYGRAFHGRSC